MTQISAEAKEKIENPMPVIEHHYTAGEKLFDATIYYGLNWIANAAISIWFANKVKNGSWKEGFDKSVKFMDEFNPIVWFKGAGAEPNKWTQQGMFILSLCSGGTVTILPSKFAEDNRTALVKYADGFIYGERAKTDPEILRAHEELSKKPAQSWETLLKGRGYAVLAAVATDFTLGSKQNSFLGHITRNSGLQKWVTIEGVGETFGGFLKSRGLKFKPDLSPKDGERLERLGLFGVYDMLLSYIAARVLDVTSHNMALKKSSPKQNEPTEEQVIFREEKRKLFMEGAEPTAANTLPTSAAQEKPTTTIAGERSVAPLESATAQQIVAAGAR
jgi:hypothetical protein